MITTLTKAGCLIAASLLSVPAISLAAAAQEPALAAAEQPLAPERNPPGDIPDNQLFIDYSSPLGFSLQVPEGWARHDLSNGARFADKYSQITVTEEAAPSAPAAATAQQTLVPKIKSQAHAVGIKKIADVRMPAASGVLVSYGSNSDPNAVTNKAIRLESDRYYFWKNGRSVVLDLSAPAGADNVDQWSLMAHSFSWR